MQTSAELARKLNAMTLQVGLVGSDGIVLASDRKIRTLEYGSDSVSMGSKFLRGAGSVCCWSGDSISEQCAYAVRAYDWATVPDDVEEMRSALKQLGNSAYRATEDQHGVPLNCIRKVLAAVRNQLWVVEIGGRDTSTANQVLDRAVTGDIHNTCRYFMNKYANDCYFSPVNNLIGLAAYTILAAGEENPYGVGGLEVYVIPAGQPAILLDAARERDLKIWFERTAETIRGMLLNDGTST